MWKLIVIRPHRLTIQEDNEKECRGTLELVPYSDSVLYAFLYDNTGLLRETYIRTIER